MQEPCAEQQCAATSPSLEVKQEPPDVSPTHWTPEHFLQSTLHEGNGVVCLAPPCEEQGDEKFSERIKEKQEHQSIKTTKGRRKQQWKLKFHHQALPPEYLDHYEASLSKSHPMAAPPTHTTSSAAQTDLPPTPFYDTNNLSSESIQNWLQRITSLQNTLQKGPPLPSSIHPPAPSSSKKRRNFLVQNESLGSSPSSKVVNYRDLPYMGEMTLNNSKPRRGRKPKKADICHLIYKNYGTILPGTPGHLMDERLNGVVSPDKGVQIKCELGEKNDNVVPPNKQRTDLQNKIISSLLEKRLSLESKKHKEVKLKRSKSAQLEDDLSVDRIRDIQDPPSENPNHSEPLNLCVRDLNNLKIRLLRKHGNVYTKAKVETKVELDKSDNESDILSDIKSSVESFPSTSVPDRVSVSPKFDVLYKKSNALETASLGESQITTVGKIDQGAESPLPGGYVYWPNAGVFVHPLTLQSQLLYYQGLAAGNSYTIPPEKSPSSPNSSRQDRGTPQSIESEQRNSPTVCSETSATSTKVKRGAGVRASPSTPAKRKRSAIFIPPMPAENTSSPATEVSICKFKFTGGARPSLQEKKMLSVDSGGNFRYYSGTGDKANRGYEFFPRESLQQSVGAGTGSAAGGAPLLPSPASINEDPAKKKRKSRKSIQREKLEKTFKEKGFLIQTQQLESAEGATYCKFRQLRKFTRYLFRSWKDYLPGVSQDGENVNKPIAPLPATPVGLVGAEWA